MSLKNGFLVHSFLKQTSSCNIPFFKIILSVLNCQYLLSFIWVPVCLQKLDLLCTMLKYNLYITAQKYNIILIIQRYKSKLVHISVSFIYFCKHIRVTRILLVFFLPLLQFCKRKHKRFTAPSEYIDSTVWFINSAHISTIFLLRVYLNLMIHSSVEADTPSLCMFSSTYVLLKCLLARLSLFIEFAQH